MFWYIRFMEIWKEIENSYGPYEISSEGRLRRYGRLLKPRMHPKLGYVQAAIYFSKYQAKYPLVHRLVVETFIGIIPSGCQVNHKNGNRSDNRIENLEVMTASENNLHAYSVLGKERPSGSKHPMAKLTEEDVLRIREQYLFGARQIDIAHVFGIDKTSVRDIVHRYGWTHI